MDGDYARGMPSYLRWKLESATYCFTVVAYDRHPWFRSARSRRLLGAAFREARQRYPFKIDAMVLMPEHLHVVMCPAGDVDYSALWRFIKTAFTRALVRGLPVAHPARSSRRPGERSVWQRRFYEHTIRDETDWGRHIDYIHWNPVSHGLVASPLDWPSSSLHRFIRNGWLEPDWPGDKKLVFPDVAE